MYPFAMTVFKHITLIAAAALLPLNCAPSLAEGFPGKGDRLLYADALPHYNLGNKYLAKEWYEKAVEKYLDAIKIYEYDADVYLNLAVAYRKLGNLEAAEDASRKAVELNGDDWTGWSNLGNMLMAQEKFPEAYKTFVRAMKCKDIPPQEKTFIESNIDGMKKILKARGLTIDGKPLAPPAVADVAAANTAKSKKPSVTEKARAGTPGISSPSKVTTQASSARGASVGGTATAGKTITSAPVAKRKNTVRPSQLAGAKESELDSGAYDQWLGN